MRLIVGEPGTIIQVLQKYGKPCFVYNIGSMFMMDGIEVLKNLTPSTNRLVVSGMFLDDRQFDIEYANYLVNNDNAFFDMMKIMYNIYQGYDIFCIADLKDEYTELLIESILKFIQQRYGFNGQMIGDVEDFDLTEDSTFTVHGIYNFDMDKERMVMMCPVQ